MEKPCFGLPTPKFTGTLVQRLAGMLGFAVAAGLMSLQSSAVAAPDAYEAGYLIVPIAGPVARSYNAGYSIYVPAWPLQRYYPGHRFQSGLPGTWMFAQYRGPAPKNMYSDVEGGLGWWRNTRFATVTPKFVMGGVGPNFNEIADGPGTGTGTWANPGGRYGVAQLSPWLLFPPDGLNFKRGVHGSLVGYGYLNLPLSGAPGILGPRNIPSGNNCWTLFMNTANFKGPVAFFTPYYWAQNGLKYPNLVGKLLDTRPAQPNRAVQMETQYIPCRVAQDSAGHWYARVAPTYFPQNFRGASALVHEDTVYDKTALWDAVARWFAGGPPASGAVNPKGALQRVFAGQGYATWEIRIDEGGGKESKAPVDWNMFAKPTIFNSNTYGYRWVKGMVKRVRGHGGLVSLPEYYHLQPAIGTSKAQWVPVPPQSVPLETGLQKIKWHTPNEAPGKPFIAPETPTSAFKSPGPAAGPFNVRLGDGTYVTYYWYKFENQPAILHAGLSDNQREEMQLRVEKLQRLWTRNRNYLPPPAFGKLAAIDPALIVTPPKGLEIGYVPIATGQHLVENAPASR